MPGGMRSIFRAGALIVAHALSVAALGAQTRDTVDKTFFTARDLAYTGAVVGGSAIVAAFDERIAHWTQSPHVQGTSSRQDLAENLTVVNEVPLTIGAVALYGIGRLAGSETWADVGLHTTEALALTVGLTEVVRGTLGRVRPRASPGDAFNFKPGKGFTDFAARSYPSIHAAVAFTAASALVEEMKVRHVGAVKYAAPVLYVAATVPGFTRLYLDQHWASDVFAGTFAGLWLGHKVVHYAHTHGRTRLDRALLGAAVLPDGHGGAMVTVNFAP
jgi:hypothetical protein